MGAPCGRLPRRRSYRSSDPVGWRVSLWLAAVAAVLFAFLALALSGRPEVL
jgi:hypothetical protein